MRPPRPSMLALAVATVLSAPLAPPARANTATGTLSVTATVLSLCTVSTLPLAFGNYNSAQLDAATTLAVTCTGGTAYSVGLDAGTGAGATTALRQMTGAGGATLGYAVYSNAGRTAAWGNSPGTDTLAGTGSGVPQTINVYGRVAAGQYPAPGAYTDTVTVTLTY